MNTLFFKSNTIFNKIRWLFLLLLFLVTVVGGYLLGVNHGRSFEQEQYLIRRNTSEIYQNNYFKPSPTPVKNISIESIFGLNSSIASKCVSPDDPFKEARGYSNSLPKYSCSLTVGTSKVSIGLYVYNKPDDAGANQLLSWVSDRMVNYGSLVKGASVLTGKGSESISVGKIMSNRSFITKEGKKANEVIFGVVTQRDNVVVKTEPSSPVYFVDLSTLEEKRFLEVGDNPLSQVTSDNQRTVKEDAMIKSLTVWFVDNVDVTSD